MYCAYFYGVNTPSQIVLAVHLTSKFTNSNIILELLAHFGIILDYLSKLIPQVNYIKKGAWGQLTLREGYVCQKKVIK